MKSFEFYNPTKIIFGGESLNKLPDLLAKEDKNILLAYGGGSIKKNGIYDQVLSLLNKEEKNVFELSGIMPNPRLDKVEEGIAICKEKKIDFILAVGGGSVIDCAKAIAIGSKIEGSVWDTFYLHKEKPTSAIPIGTVLTISATGSEMNTGSVITNWETHEKKGFKSEKLYPRFSILDPIYTYTLPKEQTVYGSIDILAHCFETYFSFPEEDNVSDAIAEGLMQIVIDSVKIAVENPTDDTARSNLMWASTMALNGITRIGKEQDWNSHNIEHALSGIFDIPHGAGLSILFPNWMEYVYENAIPKFKRYAIHIWKVNPEGKTDLQIAKEGIDKTKEFFKMLGAPTTLKEVGISQEQIEQVVEIASVGKGSYRTIEKDDVRAILEKSQ